MGHPGREGGVRLAAALLAVVVAGCGAQAAPSAVVVERTVTLAVTRTVTTERPLTATPTPAPTVAPTVALETIRGTMTLGLDGAQVTFNQGGSTCVGKGGFDDIRPGAQVRVTDGSGQVLAVGQLDGPGVVAEGCVFSFSVQVPPADFYTVEVSHRGGLTYSRAEMESRGWTVAFSLD